jgi:hypothetical protein
MPARVTELRVVDVSREHSRDPRDLARVAAPDPLQDDTDNRCGVESTA